MRPDVERLKRSAYDTQLQNTWTRVILKDIFSFNQFFVEEKLW